MQNDFRPRHLKKAKEILSKELKAVKVNTDINTVYKKEIFDKLSLWEKLLSLFKP